MWTYLSAIALLLLIGGGLTLLLLIAERLLVNYGPCEIRVNEAEPFTIEGGGTLLDALYHQRIFIPSACGGQGTCGFCKVTVRDGGGPVLPTELPYLSRRERAEGVRLACQVKVKQPITLHVREDYLNVQEFTARVASARMVTHDVRELLLDLIEPETIDFRPGQYVQIRVPQRGEPTYRAYSISSPPSENGRIELLVRLIPGGLGSTYLHNVQVGEELIFTGPYGEFVLDEEPATKLVCVGGGCGMAPMRSILRHVRQLDPDRECWLFFGARTTRDVMYLEEFRKLAETMPNLHVHYALSDPDGAEAWDGETGFIHESVQAHIDADGPKQAFLCGPPLMIQATKKVLQDKNVPDEKVFFDEF